MTKQAGLRLPHPRHQLRRPSARGLAATGCRRADMENRIAELRRDLGSGGFA